jgi:glycosyltransferase involved in cell wall biosynthesis
VSRPVVSCIVPVYNGEAYLGAALDSILAQTWRPLEIIVVDDGSTDGSAAVAETYGAIVRVIRQANAGCAAARNAGLAAATGEFVAFLDADDVWHPEKLDRQMARFEARPELDYTVTHVQNFWQDDVREEEELHRGHKRAQPIPGYVHGTLLGRRSLFDTLGPFDTGVNHGDATLWFLRARESGATSELLPDVLMRRRLHTENRSRIHAQRSRGTFLDILKQSLDRKRGLK